jgi:hypothetical protein
MRHLATFFFGLLLVSQLFAQSGAIIPQGGAGHTPQASCIILKLDNRPCSNQSALGELRIREHR